MLIYIAILIQYVLKISRPHICCSSFLSKWWTMILLKSRWYSYYLQLSNSKSTSNTILGYIFNRIYLMSTYFQVCLANLAKVINCDSNNVLWNRYYKSNRKYRSIAIDRVRPQTLRGGILGTWQYCSHNCSSCCRAGLLTQFLWPATACHWSGFRRLQKIGRNIITSEWNRTENVHGCIN